MKTKKFGENLALNKKTIANLSNVQLGKVRGGVSGYNTGCCPTEVTGLACTLITCETCPTCVTCAGLTCDISRCIC